MYDVVPKPKRPPQQPGFQEHEEVEEEVPVVDRDIKRCIPAVAEGLHQPVNDVLSPVSSLSHRTRPMVPHRLCEGGWFPVVVPR